MKTSRIKILVPAVVLCIGLTVFVLVYGKPGWRIGAVQDTQPGPEIRIGQENRADGGNRMNPDTQLGLENRIGPDTQADGEIWIGQDTRADGEIRIGQDTRADEEIRMGQDTQADGEIRIGQDTQADGEIRISPDSQPEPEIQIAQAPQPTQESQPTQYQIYQQRMDAVKTEGDIPGQGFDIVEGQVFPVVLEGTGEATLIPAYDRQYRRLVLFFAGEDGRIACRTDRLETNFQYRGQLAQPNERIAAVSFQDLNSDGKTDIVLITMCRKEAKAGGAEGRSYKVGDVLFQGDGAFYRDYRLSDKINRFGMNKSVKFLTTFIRDGYSTEFLYTATTEEELSAHGFEPVGDHMGYHQFEKLGRLKLLPGVYHMAEYTVFMIYLVNDQGLIVWSFQPMGDYESLYGPKGIVVQDIDGDGLKDLAVLGEYSYEGSSGETVVQDGYCVYYQRTAGFYEDKEIKKAVTCGEKETMSELVGRLRAFWGWRT